MYYYSLNDYLKEHYREKIYKLSLNAEVTCPNRDGSIGTKGCIFCRDGGRTVFSTDASNDIGKQIVEAKHLIEKKTIAKSFIAYFQSYSNTYGDIEYLKKIFFEAAEHDEVKIISIATRPDCLGENVLKLLEELTHLKKVWVELGLQTVHEKSAEYIRRGYPLATYEMALNELTGIGIDCITHVILGLKNESDSDMLETVRYVAGGKSAGIKFHLLHVLKNTDLEKEYLRGELDILTKEKYIDLVTDMIEYLPLKMVIHRLSGDGDKNYLIAPKWSANKKDVLNSFRQVMKEKDTTQGRKFNLYV